MGKKENRFDRILDAIEGFLSVILSVVMITVTLMIIIWRYALNAPLTWGEEAARYLTIWFIYVGVCVAAKRGSHLGVEAFTLMMPPKIRKIVKWISDLFNILAFSFLAYCGFRMAVQYASTKQVSTMMRIPMVVVFCIVPIGLIVSVYHYICRMIDNIKAANDSEEERP